MWYLIKFTSGVVRIIQAWNIPWSDTEFGHADRPFVLHFRE